MEGFEEKKVPTGNLLDAAWNALHWFESIYCQPNHYIARNLRYALTQDEGQIDLPTNEKSPNEIEQQDNSDLED